MNSVLSDEVDQTYRQYVRLLLQITKSFSLSVEQGEDVVHEVFMKFIQKKSTIAFEKRKSFLAVATKNLCIDLVRQRKNQKTAPSDELDRYDEEDSLWGNDREKSKHMAKAIKIIEDVANRPGATEFKNYYIDGLSIAHIANNFAINEGTVRVRIHRIRKKYNKELRKKLKDLSRHL